MVRLAVPVLLLFACGTAQAQESAAAELLRRVPDDMALCVVVRDLRGHTENLLREAWFEKVKANPLVRGILASREMSDLVRLEKELKKHIDLDWPTLRDDILGDGVVFAFQPAAPDRKEKGILLVRARKPSVLSQVIERFNTLQTNLGELTSLEPRKHRERTYHRRVHQQATHYYFQDGPLFAITSDEALLQTVLERGSDSPSPALEHMKRASLEGVLGTIWFNPRAFDAELEQTTRKKLGAEGVVLENMLRFWKGLDGILIGLGGPTPLELRLTLLAGPGNDARTWLSSSGTASDLWQRFPEKAMLSTAGRIDFTRLIGQVLELSPSKDRKVLQEFFDKQLRAATGLSFFQKILPQIGPDLGFSIFAAEDPTHIPQALVALAVKPGPAEAPVDQSLFNSLQLLGGLVVFDYNRKHPEPIHIRSTRQGAVDVKYLAQDRLFPSGFQPALALKDGYLLLATSPQAIARFGASGATATDNGEVPLVKVSTVEMARVMRQRRELLVGHMVRQGKETPASAGEILDALAAGLETFQSLHLSQRTADGQATWFLRLR